MRINTPISNLSDLVNKDFTDLDDTPSGYTGEGEQGLRINTGETAIEPYSSEEEAHASEHQSGGADEMNVGSLSGVLAQRQLTKQHATRHKDGGADELDASELAGALGTANQVPKSDGSAISWGNVGHSEVTGVTSDQHHAQSHASRHKDGNADELDVAELAGALGSANEVVKSDGSAASWGNVAHSEVTSVTSDQHHDKDHSSRHQNGGADEISVGGLSGDLADAQDPKSHATSHKDGNSDELDASDLAGAKGSSGQVLKTDGAALSWGDPPIHGVELTVSDFKVYDGTGTMLTPSHLNDDDTGTEATADAVNEYVEVNLGKVARITQYRQYGSTSNNGDGEWKIQYYDDVNESWNDWITGITTRTTNDWGAWSSGSEVITTKIRLVCTVVDTKYSDSRILQLEIKH